MKEEILKQMLKKVNPVLLSSMCYRTPSDEQGIYCLKALQVFHDSNQFDTMLIYGVEENES